MKRAIFNEVVEWIESRLTINPSVDDIACGVGYSRRFVYNLFHEHAGLPVGKYIRMRRMTLAAGKLKLTQQSISSIACLLHFDSHQTFSREFKKTFGLHPRSVPGFDLLGYVVTLSESGTAGRRRTGTLPLFS